MPVRFIDCYVVGTSQKHDAYKKKNTASGRDEDRVKIKTTRITDCKRVVIQNEDVEQEEEQELMCDEEEIEPEEERQDASSMQTIMEGFRSFMKREGVM